MNKNPSNDPSVSGEEEPLDEIPPDAFAPVMDPDLVPGAKAGTPEEETAREHPEETGS
ncbi:hypothetical protein [Arthrobacter sp. ISL-72]|uniref:hypothetical protein n=1 Tax=Arthrobacter sp. ISL-72 TaxID=2819114 RepID=UPI001BE8FD1E|nr:hypothetical protein [Arthrobacter sp. ISL-72]MBT2597001.1 hypothetical protein [Arthrobacter sp. ISL-72]